ncbi:hypothetical protein BKA70DRAFT_1451340 [Coprinopsis sp. MPI-PUGE-AT-0042]|nr:hypothetical protein BKA70DRAFT_1451340 [Coprinopsis sp. MPI-PUGE-AT-0042]
MGISSGPGTTLHNMPWSMDDDCVMVLLKAAERLTPASSQLPPRPPFTPEVIVTLHLHFNHAVPLNATVYSCLITIFWAVGRTGEFTVPSVKAFEKTPASWITPAGKRISDIGLLGILVTEFKVPVTKCEQ